MMKEIENPYVQYMYSYPHKTAYRALSNISIKVGKGTESLAAAIVNNSSVTNSSYKNYYIAQVAILWYEDYFCKHVVV